MQGPARSSVLSLEELYELSIPEAPFACLSTFRKSTSMNLRLSRVLTFVDPVGIETGSDNVAVYASGKTLL